MVCWKIRMPLFCDQFHHLFSFSIWTEWQLLLLQFFITRDWLILQLLEHLPLMRKTEVQIPALNQIRQVCVAFWCILYFLKCYWFFFPCVDIHLYLNSILCVRNLYYERFNSTLSYTASYFSIGILWLGESVLMDWYDNVDLQVCFIKI